MRRRGSENRERRRSSPPANAMRKAPTMNAEMAAKAEALRMETRAKKMAELVGWHVLCCKAHLLPPTGNAHTRECQHAGFRLKRPTLQEAKLVEEETEARVAQLVEAKVAEVLGSSVVQASLKARLEAERKALEGQVRVCVGGGHLDYQRCWIRSVFSHGKPAEGCCRLPQVEAELEAERLAAEEEARNERKAIEQQKAELQRLEKEKKTAEERAKAEAEATEAKEAERRFQELQVGVMRMQGGGLLLALRTTGLSYPG